MVTLANELHSVKVESPILVTELGMATLANELQPLKASSSIAITSPEISTTNKSSTSQPEAWKLEHTTSWMLRKARTSAPGMASETSSSLFNRCLSPTTTSTELMLRLDSSSQGSQACSCLLNSQMVVWADTTNESSSPDSCRTVISLAMAGIRSASAPNRWFPSVFVSPV